MERSWFETIQLLGLDLMGASALLMLLLARLTDAVISAARLVSRRFAPSADRGSVRVAEPMNDAWPPKEWRPSH
jgi:hypothetical protein